MTNNQKDQMLQIAIADGKALVILSMIKCGNEFDLLVKSINRSMELELISHETSINMEIEGEKHSFKGLFKEYSDTKKQASFVMKHPILFCIDFGDFRYEGMMPKGTRENLRRHNVKEIVFAVSNQVAPSYATKSKKMKKVTISGISNIQI
ncbi:RNA polymerase alpha/RpoL/Rpb11 family protein [Radiobacillus deserti]|uniref:Uncharacterized protein n=1 Tax=Radiobacillus deserti TaxID=2594883 RepID=A0A516KD79_9BACI|nr:hypothetical protein [Radiobacillus deserti]QDP39365.1 hypothetical protein FN924_03665 [Radiobacillus deserti]